MDVKSGSSEFSSNGRGAGSLLRSISGDSRLWLLCAVFLTFSISLVNDCLLYTPDSARYLNWAQSLAAFRGFADASAPEVVRYVVHAPLYPLLLAPLGWIFSNIVIPSKILTMVLMAALIVMFYRWSRSAVGAPAALMGSFFLAFNGLTLTLSSQVLSDVPFSLSVLGLLLIAERMEEEPQNQGLAWMYAGVLTAAILLREAGVTLLAGSVVYFALRKRYFALLTSLAVPLLFYLLWFYRNEVFIAGIESPPLRNSRLILRNSFTPEDAGFLQELAARLQINLVVYAKMAKGLILFPLFLTRSYPVVWPSDAAMAVTTKFLALVQYPLVIVQFGLLVWGAVVYRRRPSMLLLGLLGFFYMGLILIYPINDIRFFFPFLGPAIFFVLAGAVDLLARWESWWRGQSLVKSLGWTLLLICTLPTFVWMYDFAYHAWAYKQSSERVVERRDAPPETPELYLRPVARVGRWISEHSDPSTIVFARWKELSFWLQGRKMLDSEPTISFSLFEAGLRDYNVGFIVNYVMYPGIREFEFQMLKSTRYEFRPVFRAGSFEVVQVVDREEGRQVSPVPSVRGALLPSLAVADQEQMARDLFAEGIRALEGHRELDAFNTFSVLTNLSGGSAYLALFRGVALSFGGRFDRALSYLARFGYEQQAGQFLMEARFHSVLIHEFQKAEEDSVPSQKAGVLHRISANYWDKGFHDWAQAVLRKSLQADSAFTPSMIFGVYYALEQGDLAEAKRYLAMVENIRPPHPMRGPVHMILSLADSVMRGGSVEVRAGHELELAQSYAAIGLNELAIDHALAALALDERNAPALVLLAKAYEIKRRYWPATCVLTKLLLINPEDEAARNKLAELRWFTK